MKGQRIVKGLIGVVLLAGAAVAWGTDFCVNSVSGLQTALLQAAVNGQDDRVRIVQGSYTGFFFSSGSEGYALEVLGGFTAGCAGRTIDPANTILRGGGANTVLALVSTGEADFTVEGLTITGGNRGNGAGGGLYASTQRDMTVRHNLFEANAAAPGDGGGAYISGRDLTLERNGFSHNTIFVYYGQGGLGGGARLNASRNATLIDNSFTDNNANGVENVYRCSGGVAVFASNVSLTGNSFVNNTSNCLGGGAYVSGTSATLTGNSFIGNSAGGTGGVGAYAEGGGAYVSSTSATLTGNSFANNTSTGSGGAYVNGGSVNLTNNSFVDNSSSGSCGGVEVASDQFALNNNRFRLNSASSQGGGGCTYTEHATLTNNSFAANDANSGGGLVVYGRYGGLTNGASINLYNNVFWQNVANQQGKDLWISNDGENDFIPAQTVFSHNDFDQTFDSGYWVTLPVIIDESNRNAIDPQFADPLLHLAAGSPLIDAGDSSALALPATDMDGEARIQGAAVEIGADEFNPNGIAQIITFGAPPAIRVGGTGTVTATGGGSGNPVTFTSQTPQACTSSGTYGSTITGVAAGNCIIAANQAGSTTYNPAVQVTQSFAIAKGDQTIAFGAPPAILVVSTSATVTASGGRSVNPVLFTSQTPAVCTSGGTNGSSITGMSAGTCLIAANQDGDGNYNPAPPVTQSFAVTAGLVMTFDAQSKGTAFPYGNTYTENGLLATSYSHDAQFGDPFYTMETTPLYFAGANEYIEFRRVDGGTFDLVNFYLVTDGNGERWIETSRTTQRASLGLHYPPALLPFTGAEYADIAWFRVGTTGYATQLDTIRVLPRGGDVCQAGPLTLDATTFGPGTHARASQTSLATQGAVTLEAGADVTFRAPLQRFGPGLRVAAGARLQARAEAVTCGAANSAQASRARTTAGTAAATARTLATGTAAAPLVAPLVAPLAIARAADLPDWVQDRLTARGVDPAALAQALLDPQGQWLVFETTQAIDPADRNAASDIYRLDLLAERLTLLSRTPQGTAGNGPSRYPATDALGDWVVFQSEADDLVADDDNGVSDIVLHEVALGAMRRVTVASDQAAAHPALDAAGQDLLYDQPDADGRRQIHADRLWGGTPSAPLSAARDATGAPLDNHHPAISADGRFVAYLEERTAGTASDCQLQVIDRDRGRTQRQSCPAALAAASEEARPSFSADGGQVEWSIPGTDEPVIVPNPLLEGAPKVAP